MPVYVVRITDRQKYGDQVSVHGDRESGQQFLYYYVSKRWELHELGDIEDYNVADVIDKFFAELSGRYSYYMGLQDIHGAIEDDSDIVEMTSKEVGATRAALEASWNIIGRKPSYPGKSRDRATLNSAWKKLGN